ncbi:DNA-dependent metalloprotease SPRTN isoform X2 [Heterodontus francisci]|uniref:DNA-dependent metalloprotease SPRTN isoform X2 n=1 Tax=Heterodontus francisci TaxID=7792 RepID=UPI00355BB626
MEADLLLALQLQAAWEEEDANAAPTPRSAGQQAPLSVVDGEWELIDPNPNLHDLFLQFNDVYFWGRLAGVEVRWSPRMTLCAGVCCYEGRGGLCSIRISEPLLKLRPRRDLVEIYHNFHDEVDEYRQHWWRCDGPCQNRRPYFGYVKRAMNRAPSARDPWWAEHQRTCGGTYSKVKEPENYKAKKEKSGGALKKPSKPQKDRDKSLSVDVGSVIPFNGKGHVLGGKRTDSPSQRTPLGKIPESSKLLSPPSQFAPLAPELRSGSCAVAFSQQKASPQAANSSDPVKLGAGSPSVLTGWLLKSPGNSASPKTARKSVSNTRAFVSINGSPVKINTEPAKSTKGTASKSSQKRPVTELHATPCQSGCSATGTSTRKKVRAEPSILHAFVRSPADRHGDRSFGPSMPGETVSRNWHDQKGANKPSQMGSPAGDTGTSTSSVLVNCPICHSAISPSEINQHLDSCLR